MARVDTVNKSSGLLASGVAMEILGPPMMMEEGNTMDDEGWT